jgi:hypothetical protein
MDFLGIPGILDADQVRDLLRHRQSERMRAQARSPRQPSSAAAEPASVSAHERLTALRRELNGLVAAWLHRSGEPHGVIHAELRRVCGGPPAAAASADELGARISAIRSWAARPRAIGKASGKTDGKTSRQG